MLSSHAGEVAFPGGKRDPEDLDAIATALREAEEEMHLDPSDVHVIARLPPVLSKHCLSVTPVVGEITEQVFTRLVPCPSEVDAIFSMPLHWFLEDHSRHTYQGMAMGGFQYRIHYFQHEVYCVWGLTAGMAIRVAEAAFGTPAEFSVLGTTQDYSKLYSDDGKQVCIRQGL